MSAVPSADQSPPAAPGHSRQLRRRTQWLVGVAAFIAVSGLAIWIARERLAERLITRQLDQAGVTASYDIVELTPTHQVLRNVRIGNAARPDLVAREVELWVGYGWAGPAIREVRVRGARLNARYDGSRVRFGQLDRLLPEPSSEPFATPDIGLDLEDIAAVIETRWGHVAVGLEGRGNPLYDFSGHGAFLSSDLSAAGCQSRNLRGSGRLRSDADGFRFAGPIRAATLDCPAQGSGFANLVTQIALSAPADFSAVRWSGNFEIARAATAQASLAALQGRTDGSWDIARGRGSGFARGLFDDARLPSIDARHGALNGQFAFAGNQWRANGGLALAGSSLSGDAARYLGALAGQRSAPVIGPVAGAFGNAAQRASQNFLLTMPFAVRGASGGVVAEISRVTARARSGAVMTFAAPDPVLSWNRAGLSMSGDIDIYGGGLPTINGAIERTSDGGYRGSIVANSFVAGDSALALQMLRFALDNRGNGRFSTAVEASGPFAGGRVDGLALPLSGSIGPGGRLTIDSGCRAVTYRTLRLSNLTLDQQSVRLCSEAGRPLLAIGNGAVTGSMQTGPLALAGRLGASPIRLSVSGGRYRLAGAGNFQNLALSVGDGDSAVLLNARDLTLVSASSGLSGTFAGADARIGAIQLVLDGLQGQWRYAGGVFGAEGEMDVSDVVARDANNQIVQGINGQPFQRFARMTIPNARFTLANGIIEVAGQFQERVTATPIASVRLIHRLSSGTGNAAFNIVPIRFTQGGLQPEQLSELALGVAANVNATVTGNGRLEWTPQGISSTGEFSTEGANLAAAFGPVQGLTGTIRFDDLLNLTTAPGQRVTISSINPGIEVVEGELFYQLMPGQQVRIEGGRWPFAGGVLRLHPGLIDLSADRPRYLTFDVEGIDAARFLQRYGFENISASGVFDGVLPTIFDGNGGRVQGGALTVRDGGGSLAYVGELTNRDLGYFGNLAFGALRSIRYDALVIRLNGNIDGEMLTEVSFTGLGQGPGARDNFLTRQVARLPFAFNIRINAPFRQLLTSARSLYDPTVLIDQNLPTLLREQVEAEARARAGALAAPVPSSSPAEPPVQQQESGDQP